MRVNLGCGQVYMEGWTNVDASRDVKADIYMEAADFLRQYADEIDEVYMGHVLEHVAIEIQHQAGFPVTFGKTRGSGKVGQYHVVFEYEDAWVGMAAGELALRLLHHLIPAELAKGFGLFQSKPATAFSPVAVTTDELGEAWRGGRLHLTL